jgi:hypothetical protein
LRIDEKTLAKQPLTYPPAESRAKVFAKSSRMGLNTSPVAVVSPQTVTRYSRKIGGLEVEFLPVAELQQSCAT